MSPEPTVAGQRRNLALRALTFASFADPMHLSQTKLLRKEKRRKLCQGDDDLWLDGSCSDSDCKLEIAQAGHTFTKSKCRDAT